MHQRRTNGRRMLRAFPRHKQRFFWHVQINSFESNTLQLLQQIINGLVLGSMYALVALGYTMVYGIINLINFAHGEVLMVGAITSWTAIGWMRDASPDMPAPLVLLLAVIIACVVSAALNFAIEKIAYRPLRNAPKLAPLITAIGMSILLQTLAMIIFKPNHKAFPSLLPGYSPAMTPCIPHRTS